MGLWAQSPAFSLSDGGQAGQFRIESPGRSLVGVAGVEVLRGRQLLTLTTDTLLLGQTDHYPVADPQGAGEELGFYYQEVHGVALSLRFRIYPARPFLLFRLSVTNVGPDGRSGAPLQVRRFFFRTLPGELRLVAAPSGCYVNGWASHSPAGYYPVDDHPFHLWRWLDEPGIHNPMTPASSNGRIWSESVGALITSREALVAGGISLADQFVQTGVDLRPNRLEAWVQSQADDVALTPGEALASEWFYLEWVAFPNHDPLAQYAAAAARQMKLSIIPHAMAGWCAGDATANRTTESGMIDSLAAAVAVTETLPIQAVTLGSGYEMAWGEWTSWNRRFFSHGPEWLARRIAGSRLTPGLWLAPFVVQPRSRPAREHGEWLLRDNNGQAVTVGRWPGRGGLALDPTHPGVEEYLHQLGETLLRWGYRYLKLDYLYAAALRGRWRNAHLTRAQAYHRALRILRESLPEVFLVGDRAPLGPALGMVDAMRIGPETMPVWEPSVGKMRFFIREHPGLPALRNSLRNVATRAWMQGRWWINDPDCMVLQGELSNAELLTQATLLGLCGGQLFLSDDLDRLPADRQAVAAVLLPSMLEGADVQDLFRREMPEVVTAPVARPWGHWLLVGLFNWGEGQVERELPVDLPGLDPRRSYHIMDFWGRRYLKLDAGTAYPVFSLPAHGCVLLGLRVVRTQPQFVGSTFHIAQGGELVGWKVEPGRVTLTLELGRVAGGEVWLALPARPQSAWLDGLELPAAAIHAVAPGVWSVQFRLFKKGVLEVFYFNAKES